MNDEKNLPIKVIEKRRRDSQRTEGGGGNKPPKWQLEGDALSQHAQELEGSVAQLTAAFEAHQQEQSELPMVMVTTISDEDYKRPLWDTISKIIYRVAIDSIDFDIVIEHIKQLKL